MKRIFLYSLFFVLCASLIPLVQADLPPLRTQDTVRVQGGRVRFSGVLADDNGDVYIEVPRNMIAKVAGQVHFNFDGFLLAPNIISLPAKFPRSRSREIISFDFLADDGSPVHFSDKFYRVPLKQQLFTDNEKARLITAYIPVFAEENVQKPELWHYDEMLTEDETDDEWRRVGGVFDETADPNVLLFSAVISKTGIYTLMDRRPLPRDVDNIDPNIVELAEDSPFPSVEPLPNQEDIPVDTTFDPFFEEDPFAPSDNANTNTISLSPDDPDGSGGSGEIPAVSPLPQTENEGTVPISFQEFQDRQQFESEIPSIEQQQANTQNDDPLQDSIDSLDPEGPGDDLAPSVIFEDDGRLPALTEEDILAEIERLNREQGVGSPEGASLQANTFEGDNLPRTGGHSSNNMIWIGVLILAGTAYWYRKERKAMKEEMR